MHPMSIACPRVGVFGRVIATVPEPVYRVGFLVGVVTLPKSEFSGRSDFLEIKAGITPGSVAPNRKPARPAID